MEIFELWDLYKEKVENEVRGWFFTHDLITFWLIDLIQKKASWNGHFCELGTYEGKSAITLGKLAGPDEKLFCFDNFEEVAQSTAAANIHRFCPDLKDRLVCIRQDLTKLQSPPPQVELNSVRFVHIDAAHGHSAVVNDLVNFLPLLTREAVIVLDDYFDPDYPGVSTAMTEFCLSDMGRHIRPFAASRSKMYLCARPYVELYQRCIVASAHIQNMNFEHVLDVSVLCCFSRFPLPTEELLRVLNAGDSAR
jgi:hypothetical protein